MGRTMVPKLVSAGALLLLASACSGGGTETLDSDDYAEAVCDAIDESTERLEDEVDLDDFFDELFSGEDIDDDDAEDLLEQAQEGLEVQLEVMKDLTDELDGVEADDSDGEEFRTELVEAMEDGIEDVEKAIEDLDELDGDDVADDIDEFIETVEPFGFLLPIFEVLEDSDFDDLGAEVSEECGFSEGD